MSCNINGFVIAIGAIDYDLSGNTGFVSISVLDSGDAFDMLKCAAFNDELLPVSLFSNGVSVEFLALTSLSALAEGGFNIESTGEITFKIEGIIE